MPQSTWLPNRLCVVALALLGVVGLTPRRAVAQDDSLRTADSSELVTQPMRGKSGKLRLGVIRDTHAGAIGILRRLFGDSAAESPGIYTLNMTAQTPFSLVRLLPFTTKERGRVGNYRLGRWPAERKRVTEAYVNPEGFIVVTPENQETQVSEHFRLRDFLTHDQLNVWPKYLVLREALIDKLELIAADLNARGVRTERITVLSGFRSPQYNQKGVGRGGRARDSRHQFGDAADIFIDSDGDGRMDDLNHDGRLNSKDAKFLIESVERVEQENPDLVGGAGMYRATRSHGPFVHVDVRGHRARWTRG